MSKFTDAKGRDWTVAITTGAIKTVRQRLDVDLVDLNQSTMERLADDFVLLVDVLWVLCEQQAANKQPPVDAEDFGESLVGDPIEAACSALTEAIADFFPRPEEIAAAASKCQGSRSPQKDGGTRSGQAGQSGPDGLREGDGEATGSGDSERFDAIELCHELAGQVGIDPDAKTLRELWWMARGVWDIHSRILHALIEPNRDRNAQKQPYHPWDFHPFRDATKVKRDSDLLPYNPNIMQAIQDGTWSGE